MRMRVLATTNILAAIFSALCASAAIVAPGRSPIDGRWTAKVPTTNGLSSMDVVFTFNVEGGGLAGTASAGGGAVYRLVDTSIKGDRIAFAIEGEPARYSGRLAGDRLDMQLTFKSSELGTRTWKFVAERSPDERSPAEGSTAGRTPAPQVDTAGPSIDGEWTGDVPRGGDRYIAARFEFRAEDSTLSGTVHALDDEFPITKGMIAGSRIAFAIGQTKGEYSGQVEGDTIHMKVRYNDGEHGRVTLDFVLTRVR